jgi:hypothetical protein
MGPELQQILTVAEWRHVVAQGRDQYVRVVRQGHLFPFGHRASLVSISERKMVQGLENEFLALVVRRSFITVQEPVRDFAGLAGGYVHGGLEMPLRQVRLTVLSTPNLDTKPEGVFVPFVGGHPFAWHAVALDCQGRPVDLRLPMVFVPLSATRRGCSNTAAGIAGLRSLAS